MGWGLWDPERVPLGARGERVAGRYLRRKGLRVIARNVRLSMGEIDLVCEDPRTGAVVVVEVKSRVVDSGDPRSAHPEDTVTGAKRAKLRTLATALLRDERFAGRAVRIDVVAVVFARGERRAALVRHYESAV